MNKIIALTAVASACFLTVPQRSDAGHIDGMSLYRGYFVPNATDPKGMYLDGPFGPIRPGEAGMPVPQPPAPPVPFTTEAAADYAIGRCKLACCTDGYAGIIAIKEWLTGTQGSLATELENAAREVAGDLKLTGRMHSALRHCVAGALMARVLGCKCSQCLQDQRDVAQFYFGGQSKENTLQALHNDRAGRECAGCVGKGATLNPPRRPVYPGALWTLPPRINSVAASVNCCTDALKNGKLSTGPNQGHNRPQIPFDTPPDFGGPGVTVEF